MNKKAIFIPLLLLTIQQPNGMMGAANGPDEAQTDLKETKKAIDNYLTSSEFEDDLIYSMMGMKTHESNRGWISDKHPNIQELLNRCRVEVWAGSYVYAPKCLTIANNYIAKHYPHTVVEYGLLKKAADQQPPEPMEITLPKDNPTGLSTITIDLTDNEPLIFAPFQELIEETGEKKFIILFTQPGDSKWHTTMITADGFEDLKKTQPDPLTDPTNRQPILYTVGITIKQVGSSNQFKYEIG